jgi:hypothetical protein
MLSQGDRPQIDTMPLLNVPVSSGVPRAILNPWG